MIAQPPLTERRELNRFGRFDSDSRLSISSQISQGFIPMWSGILLVVLASWLIVACCLNLDPKDKWPTNQAWSSLFGRKLANTINIAAGIAIVIVGIVLMIYMTSTH